MDHRTCIFRSFSIAILGSALLLQGCGEGNKKPEQKEESTTENDQGPKGNEKAKAWVDSIGGGNAVYALLDSMSKGNIIDDYYLQRSKLLFQYNVRQKDGTPFPPIENGCFVIPWDTIQKMLPQSSDKHRAVLFHHGLRDQKVRLGWSYRLVDTIPIPTPPGDTIELYKVHDAEDHINEYLSSQQGNAQVFKTKTEEWKDRNQRSKPLAKRYFGNVQIWEPENWADWENGNWNTLKEGEDSEYTLLHWEDKLLPLLKDNSDMIAPNSKVELVVHFTLDIRKHPTADENYLAHSEAVHLRVDGVDLIERGTIPSTPPRLMRGVNYGNLCPHRCEYIERQRQ